MRKLTSAILALFIVLLVGANASDQRELSVTGEQVNLRAGPSTDFEIVGGVVKGDSLFLSGEPQGRWFGVRPPESVDLWIHNEFIQADKVIAAKAQVRTGAGINFGSVILLRKGDRVTVREQVGEWVKIAPPAGAIVWVNADYVRRGPVETASVVRNEAPEGRGAAIPTPASVDVPVVTAIPIVTPEPVPPPARQQPTAIQQPPPVPPTKATEAPVPTATYTGILRPVGFMLRSPADFRLVAYDKHGRAVTLCYVYANKTQLKRLEGRQLILTGRIYRLNGVPYPIIEPSLIKRLN